MNLDKELADLLDEGLAPAQREKLQGMLAAPLPAPSSDLRWRVLRTSRTSPRSAPRGLAALARFAVPATLALALLAGGYGYHRIIRRAALVREAQAAAFLDAIAEEPQDVFDRDVNMLGELG